MAAFVALLRAVNVGGTGKLPMSELEGDVRGARLQRGAHLHRQRQCRLHQPQVRSRDQVRAGEAARGLCRQAGRRDGAQRRRNGAGRAPTIPFRKAAPNRTIAIFLDRQPPADALAGIRGQKDEEIRLGRREIYVHYGDGHGHSRSSSFPPRQTGTARNMNTVATLAKMAAEL